MGCEYVSEYVLKFIEKSKKKQWAAPKNSGFTR